MTANILTVRQQCRLRCPARTEGPRVGDVRRCEHGRLWLYRWGAFINYWSRLRPWLNPLAYRRAVRALRQEVTE